MRAGLRAVAAALAAVATANAAGCTLTAQAQAGSHRPAARPAAATSPPATSTPHGPLPAGVHRYTIGHRSYLLSTPRTRHRSAPLVVALGGIGTTAQGEVDWYRLSDVARRAHAVVAYPEPVNRLWNAGGCCWGANSDDVGFLSQMRDQIAAEVPLDPTRQVLLGYSNGGMLAYFAACADGHWTGIVVLGASLMTRCTPVHPFSITNVNGTKDTVAMWNGGYSGYTKAMMPAVWRIDREFAAAFRCSPARRTRSGPDIVFTYTGCQGGVTVRDVRVPGLWHHWTFKEKDGYDMGPALWHLGLG